MKELTSAEWQVMECLWDLGSASGREAVEDLARRVGWSRSTVLTMLRRMTEKGLIRKTEGADAARYAPAFPREQAVEQETSSFLDRVYHGSISLMMSAMTEHQKLSKEEIARLTAILEEAKDHA